MAVAIYVPKALYPVASSPSDWSNDSPLLVINVWLQACARVSAGPLERGPVHFLVEMHDNMTAPRACQDVEGKWHFDYALTQVWLDDQEVVDYLRNAFHLPAQFATFNVTQTDVGGGETRDSWTFGIPGESNSNLASMMKTPDGTSFPIARLYYFPTPETTAFMDLEMNTRFSGLDSREVVGKVAPPLIYASAGTQDIVAYGAPDRDGTVSARVHIFEDRECRRPV